MGSWQTKNSSGRFGASPTRRVSETSRGAGRPRSSRPRSSSDTGNPATLRLLLLLLIGLGLLCCRSARGQSVHGECSADLSFLARHYTPPARGENNHIIDLWDGGRLRTLAAAAGLTNNRALIVNSHGRGMKVGRRMRYVFYPHDKLLDGSADAPCFSAADLARIIGPQQAAQIHNIAIAGCDSERAFQASELRRHFVNATNITHVVSGESGYQPMFLQALLAASNTIQPLYERAVTDEQGRVTYHLETTPAPGAVKLSPYLAELFRPGAARPYRIQTAGRELIDPALRPLLAARAEGVGELVFNTR